MNDQQNRPNASATQALAPEALMLLSSHCAHCPTILDSLSKMIKSGELANLTIINLEMNPDAMQEYNVRSVPWVRIGSHELTGVQSIETLKQRAEWALKDLQNKDNKNMVAVFDFLLSDGQVNKVIDEIKENPQKIEIIMALLGDSGTVLSSRIGIGVIIEEFSGSNLLKSLIPQLEKLGNHANQQIQADVFYYLGLTADKKAIPILESALNRLTNKGGKSSRKDNDIQEIIEDSLEELQS